MNDDLRKLQNFRNDLVEYKGAYYAAWYVLSSASAFSLSQRTRNVISSYLDGRDRIGVDDFDNIIQIVQMLEE